MAETWVATAAAVTFASAKSMIDVFNAAGTAKVLRAYRYCMFNNQVGAVTAALSAVNIRRTTSASAGTTVTPVKHDTGSAALDANTTAGYGRTIGASDIFRRLLWLTEEATTTGVTQANWELLVPVATIFFPTGGDAALEPITCRSTQGTDIQNTGAGAVGTNDMEITFTSMGS